MIKRQYFFSAQCPRGDGNGSYSFYWVKFTKLSFFPNHDEAFEYAKKEATREFLAMGIKNPSLDITAFNSL